MAINLVCYTTIGPSTLQNKVNEFVSKYSSLFPSEYIVYPVREPDEIQKEISNENNLDPLSIFRIAMNNKESKISITDMANLLKKELGALNIIVLFEGEILI
ncbi:hypothetical protein [Photorhabdus bodei]|uniref:Uncharacterized protein n=1 Tax=Photorhabdus bodei TaxID=2029681 RepID=A0AAW6BIY9_9GAMM|nr:hypothetical protein [Photorhabdus bodei]MDB6371835.1 hypothetical protein [Photorhabdus bodei]